VPDRRGSRFVLEVLFLLALAVGLTLADLTPLEIAVVMLVGWVIVAVLEWAAWRGEPHYGSGLPPRYYVPRVNLPPAQPLEQVAAGYPEAAREEAPTWIASAALRDEMLGAWPVASAGEPVREQAEAARGVVGPATDPWLIAALPGAPLGELELEPAAVEPEPERQPLPKPLLRSEPSLDVVLARSAQGVARYSIDPLADPPARRRFGRGGSETPPSIEVSARPGGIRALPGRSARQD
jgi:hypothetical protein